MKYFMVLMLSLGLYTFSGAQDNAKNNEDCLPESSTKSERMDQDQFGINNESDMNDNADANVDENAVSKDTRRESKDASSDYSYEYYGSENNPEMDQSRQDLNDNSASSDADVNSNDTEMKSDMDSESDINADTGASSRNGSIMTPQQNEYNQYNEYNYNIEDNASASGRDDSATSMTPSSTETATVVTVEKDRDGTLENIIEAPFKVVVHTVGEVGEGVGHIGKGVGEGLGHIVIAPFKGVGKLFGWGRKDNPDKVTSVTTVTTTDDASAKNTDVDVDHNGAQDVDVDVND